MNRPNLTLTAIGTTSTHTQSNTLTVEHVWNSWILMPLFDKTSIFLNTCAVLGIVLFCLYLYKKRPNKMSLKKQNSYMRRKSYINVKKQ